MHIKPVVSVTLLLCPILPIAAASAATVDSFTEPNRQINVASAEAGIVMKMPVREGDRVRTGDVLAVLDLEVLEATLEVARARMESSGALRAAQAERDLCRNKVEKLRSLRLDEHISQGELDRAEADLAVAEAKVALAEEEQRISALEYKKIAAQLERRRIRSPSDGVVVKVRKEPGEALLYSDPVVLTLAELDRLRARFSLSYPQASRFKLGQSVIVALSETGQHAPGKVEIIAPVSDAKSGTVQVTVMLDNRKGLYRSGMRCVLDVPDDPLRIGAAAGSKLP